MVYSEQISLGNSYDDTKKMLHVGCRDGSFNVTPPMDTGGAYATGDLLFNPIELSNVFALAAATGFLVTLNIIDKDDQGGIMDLVFFSAAPASGTLNAACPWSDAEMLNQVAAVSIVAADYIDVGGAKTACRALALQVRAAASQTSLWMAGISRDSKTYTASGLVIKGEISRN